MFNRFLISVGLTILTGCASASFSPSRPVEDAPSLPEALLLCNEYHAPTPAERPVSIRPYLTCIEDSIETHPPSAESSVRTFAAEFAVHYDQLHEDAWSPRLGRQIETAVHAILRELWQPGIPTLHTAEEKITALKHFPRTARELGAQSWPVTASVAVDPELEGLKAGIAALTEAQPDAGEPLPLERAAGSRTLCREMNRLLGETRYLSSLARDRHEILMLDPEPQVRESLRERYESRLDAALRDLERLRPRAEESSFRTAQCSHG